MITSSIRNTVLYTALKFMSAYVYVPDVKSAYVTDIGFSLLYYRIVLTSPFVYA